MYILKCADNTFYTGSTWDLDRRTKQHLLGKGANYTRKKFPAELVYYEEFERIEDAFKREKQIQGWSHQKKLALIENREADLKIMAKKVFRKKVETRLDKFISVRRKAPTR